MLGAVSSHFISHFSPPSQIFFSTQAAEGELGTRRKAFPPSLRRCMERCAGRPSPLCETKRVVTSLAPLDQSISGKAGKAKCQE